MIKKIYHHVGLIKVGGDGVGEGRECLPAKTENGKHLLISFASGNDQPANDELKAKIHFQWRQKCLASPHKVCMYVHAANVSGNLTSEVLKCWQTKPYIIRESYQAVKTAALLWSHTCTSHNLRLSSLWFSDCVCNTLWLALQLILPIRLWQAHQFKQQTYLEKKVSSAKSRKSLVFSGEHMAQSVSLKRHDEMLDQLKTMLTMCRTMVLKWLTTLLKNGTRFLMQFL